MLSDTTDDVRILALTCVRGKYMVEEDSLPQPLPDVKRGAGGVNPLPRREGAGGGNASYTVASPPPFGDTGT